ncbi:MAG: hypothetical protein R2762_29125 [Bryobacteraceae bacterium]
MMFQAGGLPNALHICPGRPVGGLPPPPPPMPGAAPLPVNPVLNRRLSYYDAVRHLASEVATLGAANIPMAQKFDRALTSWLGHKPPGITASSQALDNTTVQQYMAMTDVNRLALIDQLWAEILVLMQGNTRRDAMVDPAPNAFPGIAAHPQAFRTLGYCFRCDTRAPGLVTVQGFRRAYELNAPLDIAGTLPHRAALGQGMPRQLGMWHDNRDAINEMNICVSRNAKGATKFPNPEHVGGAVLYAIKLPADQTGFDTENWQATVVGGLWRPGEKAFFDIAANHVIAHVDIDKSRAAGAGELHRFRVLGDRWNYTAHATAADRVVLGSALAEIYNGGAVQAVMRVDDFAAGQ